MGNKFVRKYPCQVCKEDREVELSKDKLKQINEHCKKLKKEEIPAGAPLCSYIDKHQNKGGIYHTIELYFEKNGNIAGGGQIFLVERKDSGGKKIKRKYLCPLCVKETEETFETMYKSLINSGYENEKAIERLTELLGKKIELSQDEIGQIQGHYRKVKEGEIPAGAPIQYIDKHSSVTGNPHVIDLILDQGLSITAKSPIYLIE